MNLSAVEKDLTTYVEQNSGRLIQILQDLVRIPSENTPPIGSEGECQKYIARFLSDLECNPLTYTFDEVPGLTEHPLFRPGREYANRPNVGARLKGHRQWPIPTALRSYRYGSRRFITVDTRSVWRGDRRKPPLRTWLQ